MSICARQLESSALWQYKLNLTVIMRMKILHEIQNCMWAVMLNSLCGLIFDNASGNVATHSQHEYCSCSHVPTME